LLVQEVGVVGVKALLLLLVVGEPEDLGLVQVWLLQQGQLTPSQLGLGVLLRLALVQQVAMAVILLLLGHLRSAP
jgi:hypothetical protein